MASPNRKKVVAGNWKMNKTWSEALALANDIAAETLPADVQVVLCTPAVYCAAVAEIVKSTPTVAIGAQNCYQEERGAYTGETSAEMLQSIGVQYVIIGHSERREYFGETSAVLAQKVDLLLSKGMTPIYCCGEPLSIRQAETHVAFVSAQIEAELFHLSAADIEKVIVAYEPIWAIGTGLTASPEQAQDMHKAIRATFAAKYGAAVADKISILYGGSANAANAASLFSQPDVDGGLIGGASLKAADFATVIRSF